MDLLTVNQVMEALKISRATMYKCIEQGMPTYRLVGQYRFDMAEIKKWMKRNREK